MGKSFIPIVIFVGLVICGCGGNSTLEKHGLVTFGLLYHEFYAANDRAPANLDEIKSFQPPALSGVSADNAALNRVFDAIEKGEIVVIWNAKLSGDGDENGLFVLAFQKDVPTQGGLMLDAGGSYNEVTPEEFESWEMIPQAK